MINHREFRKIRIMLVDDHMVIRMGLKTAISDTEDLEVVSEVKCGEEAIEAYRDCRPDVVVLELRMRGMGGLESIQALRAEFKDAKIIVFSNYAEGEVAYRALAAGAVGFVVKDMPVDTLLQAVRHVYSGKRFIPESVAVKIGNRHLLNLTPRESQVLEELARGGSNKEIASRLDLVEGTVKRHIASILQKLGAYDRTQALIIALKSGIVDLD